MKALKVRRRKTTGRIAAVVPRSQRPKNVRIVAIETLAQQADRLGLLDPLDSEPAIVYSPGDGNA